MKTTYPKTIRRNSKASVSILTGAREVRVYTLENGFTGRLCEKIDWLYPDYLRFEGKLVQTGPDTFTLTFHSNHWVKFISG